jgi:hypothetical protein
VFQVVAAIGKKPSGATGIAASIIGTISVWATDSSNLDVKIVSGKTFSLEVDVSGASSVSPLSVPSAGTSTISSLSFEKSALKSVVGTRSTGTYLFCPKSSPKECTEADWSTQPCDSSTGCSIQGTKMEIAAAANFGTYAVRAIQASPNEGSESSASQLTIAMLAALVALVHVFI